MARALRRHPRVLLLNGQDSIEEALREDGEEYEAEPGRAQATGRAPGSREVASQKAATEVQKVLEDPDRQ